MYGRSDSWLRAISVAVCVLLSVPVVNAGIKCWTNDKGQKECGNTIPPKYSQGKHEVLDKQGIIVDETSAAPTAEELEADRQNAIKLEQQIQQQKEQQRRDQVLLDTFPEESDIIRSKESKIATINNNIFLEQEKVKKITQQLESATERKKKYTDDNKEVPDILNNNIQEYERQLKNAQLYIEQSNKDKTAIATEYDAYIEQHRKLKGGSVERTRLQ